MLFLRECKRLIFSVLFVVFVGALLLMANTQEVLRFTDEYKIEKPVKGRTDDRIQSVMTVEDEDPQVIMPAALENLWMEYENNSYSAWPLGFYKEIHLSDQKQEQMTSILEQLTGTSAEEIRQLVEEENTEAINTAPVTTENPAADEESTSSGEAAAPSSTGIMTIQQGADGTPIFQPYTISVSIKKDLDYDTFIALMSQADDLIGGGSNYREEALSGLSRRAPTYEEAAAQYKLTSEKDRFTGGYARLFCDYMIVGVLGIFPVFFPVLFFLKDRRAKASALLFARQVSSARLILTRYLAMVAVMMFPTLILAYISNSSVWRMYPGEKLDYLAPLFYTLVWLLPTVMVLTALGMLLIVLTDTPIAIAAGVLWWFFDSNQGIAEWENGSVGLFRLLPRWNTELMTAGWYAQTKSFACNRLLMLLLAVLLTAAAVYVYDRKRRGRLWEKRTLPLFSK